MGKLKGKKALCVVTGGSQGIGQCIAVEMSKLFSPGSKILLVARSKEGMEKTRQQILTTTEDMSVKNYQFDLCKPEYDKYNEMFQENNGDYEVAILVHNAGSEGNGRFAVDMNDFEEWQKHMALNLYSVTMMTSAFLKVYTNLKSKTIVNITSLAAVQPFKSMGYYCVNKAAREMYFRVLAEENPELDIFSYSPGPVETDMVTRLVDKVSDPEVKSMFKTMKDESKLVKAQDTVKKLLDCLETSEYKSGGRKDYFDR
ncbi:sepiapterin reductase [Cimex lectularius]|uniref:Sepiapterin reductase n=1 Tax=Cimex lectularius TaxID=79782 RepID=A0A8I6RG72_CIMLE|nr:sepiapterin reductase [Cimex lectularius]XP_014243261.1 sepiapterin reductase [Cimex lectularius]XP_014243262.1 sepiapterin reductase [Cimex lectularius]